MFSTFTGQSAGKRRNVNLSGNRAHNPWASPATLGSSTTVSKAAAEREKRQREKERLKAAKCLQRVWRGSQTRQHLRAQNRAAIDYLYHHGQPTPEARSREALPLVLRSFQKTNYNDRQRALWLCRDLHDSRFAAFRSGAPDMIQLDRFVRVLLDASEEEADLGPQAHVVLVVLLQVLELRPQAIEPVLSQYYKVMATYCNLALSLQSPFMLLNKVVTTPLSLDKLPETFVSKAYHAFAFSFLATPDIFVFEHNLGAFAADIDLDRLSNALASEKIETTKQYISRTRLLWLLAHLIALQQTKQQQILHTSYLQVLCSLLSVLSDHIQLAGPAEQGADSGLDVTNSAEDEMAQGTLPAYVSEKLGLLTESRAITGLLESSAPYSLGHESASNSELGDASVLAGYVLTLISCFPNAGDEIRMRLFFSNIPTKKGRLPALEYLWKVMKWTPVFRSIVSGSEAALNILKTAPHPSTQDGENDSWHQQWRTILLFLELYAFVLKLTDDADFFGGLKGDQPGSNEKAGDDMPRVRSSGLGLGSVKRLTLFLKHLGFVLYYNMPELLASRTSARNLRGVSRPSMFVVTAGLDLDKVRRMVMAAMRGLYERDSRRPFLPKNHWLMTNKFDMAGFKEAVVVEAERQRALGDAEPEEEEGEDVEEDEEVFGSRHGMSATQALHRRYLQLMARRKQAAKEHHRATVGPKLEILKHMPFVIPFTKRVSIFREFIKLDKIRRRQGYADPDSWRMFMMSFDPTRNSLARHQALIRRGRLFKDAQDSLWPLGDGIKEPVQITFEDQWGMQEAGIDGGGVTKEFLTSVISEMLADTNLFVANSKNAYYPNPLILEQRLASARRHGINENEARVELLRQYEFAGRIIGKCMYEGILINVVFAGFFLLKWATADTKQVNLNDLRELDEDLYRGLLFMKNNEDEVDDLGLNFAVHDDISAPEDKQPRIVTRPLCPNGNNVPVTKENRLLYITQVAKYRLHVQPFAQTQAFLKGLKMVIEPGWLSMFNQNELQRLVGGDSGAIDVDDLRKNTEYNGPYQIGDDGEEHDTVKLFWEVMEEFGDEERREVLQYVTSTPRAPLLGFSQLYPRFTISYGGADETRLPSASTCVNLLKLPRYTSKEVLREKLLYAVKSGAGFDLS